ncbi:MAG: biotin/lipoyl-binding protein [Chloroflexi bacterium]|nr:biotin/lipoyl-binding protein [Chloroflexota bacterium]
MQVAYRLRGLALVALAALLVAGCGIADAAPVASPTPPEIPVVRSDTGVIAEGRIVPHAYVSLTPAQGGRVAEVLVAEGDAVEAGQLLVRLDDGHQRAALAEAEAALAGARANLALVSAGPEAEQIAAAEAGVEVARTAVSVASGALAAARAQQSRVQSGATDEELGIAQHQLELAKNALYAAQGQRDALCGQADALGISGMCDSAQGQVQQAEEQVRIAELQLAQVQRGAGIQDLAVVDAQVQQALGQLAGAQARVAEAEATLALLTKGATAEAIAVAESQVTQAEAAVRRATVSLEETELRASLAGRVATLYAKVGELLSPAVPAVQIADLSVWEVETDDLTELEVVAVSIGQAVSLVPDALPDLRLAGRVVAIQDAFGQRSGDIIYQVRIALEDDDPRLRWGMTVAVQFE